MKGLLEEIKVRTSKRAFDTRPVPREMLDTILEAGRLAPSCANTQEWEFVIITGPELLQQAHEGISRGNAWGKRAPVMLIVVTKENGGCGAHGLPYWMMDVGLATQNILLQSFHLGLIAHPTAGWDERKLKDVTGIPEDRRIGTVIFIGYAGDITLLDERTQGKERAPRDRKEIGEIVHHDKW